MGKTIWESMQQKGYSRRQFMQFCGAAATVAGLDSRALPRSSPPLKRKRSRPWSGCTFRSAPAAASRSSALRTRSSATCCSMCSILNYTETLMAASGFQAEKSLKDTIENNKGKYIVLVEGAVPTHDDGVYCMIGGKTAEPFCKKSPRMRPRSSPGAAALRTAACRPQSQTRQGRRRFTSW